MGNTLEVTILLETITLTNYFSHKKLRC